MWYKPSQVASCRVVSRRVKLSWGQLSIRRVGWSQLAKFNDNWSAAKSKTHMTFDKGLGVEADVSVTAAAIAFVYVCNEWRRVNALCHRRAIKAKMNFIGNNCEAPPANFIGTSFVCGIDGQAEASWKRASSFRRLPLTLSLPIPSSLLRSA